MDLLALVPLLPLAAALALVPGGRRIAGRRAGWLATGAMGAAFAVAVAIALSTAGDRAADADHAAAAGLERTYWEWIAAGEDLVEVTAARRDLLPGEQVDAAAVGLFWANPLDPGVAARLRDMWEAEAVVGHVVGPVAIPAYSVLTFGNVPPGEGDFVEAVPRTQSRFRADVSFLLDGLSLTMMLLVTGVGFLIFLFAVGYMADDPSKPRFFAYMSFFGFSMLVLVLAANYLLLFVGWELVGLSSYLLIGFWYAEEANATAGRKAFIVNRVGDFGFLLGLMLIWTVFGSLAYADVLPNAEKLLVPGSALAAAIPLLLLVGATGKSAQLPLHVWLPDAMAGPTPVSALIHAATMVTAGVYMIARSGPLFEQAPAVLATVAVVGGATALMAAVAAVVQFDIKRTLAYSTISQLGFMFLAVGAGAYIAGIAHLVIHAFYKALLFLGAGSLMHGVEHSFAVTGSRPAPRDGVPPEQDMRNMGSLLGRMRFTAWTFTVGALALAGLFPLAGFFSKDEILYSVLNHGGAVRALWIGLWAVAVITSSVTALYSGRMLLLTLARPPRGAGAVHAHESPPVMVAPLVVLACLTALGGLLLVGTGGPGPLVAVLEPVLGGHGATALVGKLPVAVIAGVATLGGLGLAWLAHRRAAFDPSRLQQTAPRLHRLAWRAFGFDELYAVLFVRPFRAVAPFLWQVVDDGLVDGAVNAVGRATMALGSAASRLQSGLVRRYALWMVLGAAALAAYLFLAAWR